MTVYTKLRITALLTLALLGLVTAVGSAGSVSILVNIDDLTEGTPSLSLSGPSPLPTPTILVFEDVVGGTLSYRLLITHDFGIPSVDVQFASDPASITLPGGAVNFSNLVEDGTFQSAGSFFGGGPFGLYIFSVKSDRADVPAPATVLLFGAGLAALASTSAWRRRTK